MIAVNKKVAQTDIDYTDYVASEAPKRGEVSDVVLEKAKKKLVTMNKTWVEGVTQGRAWSMGGKETHGKSYNACHAWVTTAFYNNTRRTKSENFLVLTCHSKKRSHGICSVEAHEAIILWLASDDFILSKFILNRDDKESLLNGGLVILCGPDGATEAEAMWLCKVLRYAIEGGKALDVWLYLKEGGVNPLLALRVATHFRTVRGASFGYTGPDAHSTVFRSEHKQVDRRWEDVDYNPALLLEPRLNKEVEETSKLFVPQGHKPVVMRSKEWRDLFPIQSFCAPTKISDGWGGTVKAEEASKETFLARVLEWQNFLRSKPLQTSK